MASKGSDQTVPMRRLIGGFAGRTYHIVGNLTHWLINDSGGITYMATSAVLQGTTIWYLHVCTRSLGTKTNLECRSDMPGNVMVSMF